MNIFELLDRESRTRNLKLLIIGGHAVNAYGYSRFTEDVDFIISKTARGGWLMALEAIGYQVQYDGGSFLLMHSPDASLCRVDVMLVNERSFAGMLAAAQTTELGGKSFSVPSLDHLIALKLHVLKQGLSHRLIKDFTDVTSLAQVNAIDVRSDRFRLLCEKYGSKEIYEKILLFQS